MTGIQVIGAGLERTGTLSLKHALEELGFSPCHHLRDTTPDHHHPRDTTPNHHPRDTTTRELDHYLRVLLRDINLDELVLRYVGPDEDDFTREVLQNEHVIREVFQNGLVLRDLFQGYQASVNHPGCLYYETLLKINPDAKVILTVRDSPEVWARSARNTVFSGNKAGNWLSWKLNRLLWGLFQPARVQLVHKLMTHKRFHGVDPHNPNTDLVQMYTDWNTRVQETVPRDKLLVYNVKEGWEPLCRFLGVPVPDTPFPRVNSAEEWNEMVSINIEVKVCDTLPRVLLVWAVLGCLYGLYKVYWR